VGLRFRELGLGWGLGFGLGLGLCHALHHHALRTSLKKAEAMVTPRRKYRRPAMVTPKSYPYP